MSTPPGTRTWIERCRSFRPSPRQSPQGSRMTLPAPRQSGQVRGHGEEPLAVLHLTPAAAHATGGGTGPGRRAAAAATVATFESRNAQLRLHSESRILERDPKVVAKIRACAPAATAGATAEDVAEAEDIAQDVREIGEDRRVEAAAGRRCLVPEAVVALPLVGIREHRVRLRRLLELLLGSAVARVAIGVVADGQLAVGRFDLLQSRRTFEAQGPRSSHAAWRISGAAGRHGDPDHRGAQQPRLHHVSGLQLLHDGGLVDFRALFPRDGLVDVRIEGRVHALPPARRRTVAEGPPSDAGSSRRRRADRPPTPRPPAPGPGCRPRPGTRAADRPPCSSAIRAAPFRRVCADCRTRPPRAAAGRPPRSPPRVRPEARLPVSGAPASTVSPPPWSSS